MYINNIILLIMEQSICSVKYNPTPIIKLRHIISNNTFDIYVFIGIVEESIKLILDKITQKDKLTKDERNILERFRNYGNHIDSVLGLDSNHRNIYFINDFINIDDTIDIIKKKIQIHLNILDIYQHLWCKSYTDSTNINKQNIYNFITDNKKINLTVSDVKKFLNNKYDIVDLSTMGDDDHIISYNEWLKNPIINQYLSITLLPIDKNTIDNKRTIPYQMNPYLLSKDKLIDYRWIDKQGNRIIQTKPLDYVILEKFYKIDNNTIYLIDFNSLHQYIKNLKLDTKLLLNGIYHRFFPKIDENDINTFKKVDPQLNQSKVLIDNQNLINLINKYYRISSDRNTYQCGITELILHIDSSSKTILLERLFNIIQLSNDNPFIKWRDPKNTSIYYKLYIPSIVENEINKNVLENWIKGRDNSKRKSNKTIIYPSKGIIFKLLLTLPDKSNFITLNIFEKGNYEVKYLFDYQDYVGYSTIKNGFKIINQFIDRLNNQLDNDKLTHMEPPLLSSSINTKISNLNFTIELPFDNYNKTELIDFLNHFRTYIVYKDDTNKRLNYHYRRINNYHNISSLDWEITNCYNQQDMLDDDIITYLMDLYKYDLETATAKLEEWKIDHSNNTIMNQDLGITISIQYIKPNYICHIRGCHNILLVNRISHLLISILYIYNNKPLLSSNELKLIDEDNAELEQLLQQQEFQDLDLLEDLDDKSKSLSISDDMDNLMGDDIGDLMGDMDDLMGMDDDLMGMDNDLMGDMDDLMGDNKQPLVKSPPPLPKKLTKKIKKTKTLEEISKYHLNRLNQYDKEMISKDEYSTKCGAVDHRQPIVISDAEKELIDKNHPNSYFKESAIRFGSTPENQNWYICPLYWCIRCNTSLSDEEMVSTMGNCPDCGGKIIINRKKPKEDETILTRNIRYWHDKKSRKPRFDGDSKKVIKEGHPNFSINTNNDKSSCQPCCFTGFKDKFGVITPKKQETLNLCEPSKIGDVEPVKKTIIKKDNTSQLRFIKKTDKLCDLNRFCELPYTLYDFFSIDLNDLLDQSKSYETRKSLLKNAIPGLYRMGNIYSNTNSFLSSILSLYQIYKFNSNDRTIMEWDLDRFNHHLVNHITCELFIQLMSGNLVNLFKNDDLYQPNPPNIKQYLLLLHREDSERIEKRETRNARKKAKKKYQDSWSNMNNQQKDKAINEFFPSDEQMRELIEMSKTVDRDYIQEMKNKFNIDKATILYYQNIMDFEQWLQEKPLNNIFTIRKDKPVVIQQLFTIYTAWNNYKNYIKSNCFKDYRYLIELVSRKNKWLFPEGINLILLEYKQDNLSLLTPLDGNINSCIANTKNEYSILLNMIDDYFEPIVSVTYNETYNTIEKKHTIDKLDHPHFKYNLLDILKTTCEIEIDKLYIQNIQIDNGVTLNDLLPDMIITFGKDDITQYINSENKTVGIFIQLQSTGEYTYYIPVNPSKLDINIKAIINVDNIRWKKYQEIIQYCDTFNKKHHHLIPIIPINNIVNKDGLSVGILVNIGEIIPINPTVMIDDSLLEKKEINLDMFIDNDIIIKNQQLDDREIYVDDYTKKQSTYQQIRFELSKLLQINNLNHSYWNHFIQKVNYIRKIKHIKDVFTQLILSLQKNSLDITNLENIIDNLINGSDKNGSIYLTQLKSIYNSIDSLDIDNQIIRNTLFILVDDKTKQLLIRSRKYQNDIDNHLYFLLPNETNSIWFNRITSLFYTNLQNTNLEFLSHLDKYNKELYVDKINVHNIQQIIELTNQLLSGDTTIDYNSINSSINTLDKILKQMKKLKNKLMVGNVSPTQMELINRHKYEIDRLKQIKWYLENNTTSYKNIISKYVYNNILSYSQKQKYIKPIVDKLTPIIITKLVNNCKKFKTINNCTRNSYCIWENGKQNICSVIPEIKSFNQNINETNELIEKYKLLLTDEFIRNRTKANEIINGNIDYFNTYNVIKRKDELLFTDTDILNNYLQKINRYITSKYHRNIKIYDFDGDDISNRNNTTINKTIQLPYSKQWIELLQKYDFNAFTNPIDIIQLLISYRNNHKIEISNLKKYIVEYLQLLDTNTSKSKKTKKIKIKGGGRKCGLCQMEGHNKQTCPKNQQTKVIHSKLGKDNNILENLMERINSSNYIPVIDDLYLFHHIFEINFIIIYDKSKKIELIGNYDIDCFIIIYYTETIYTKLFYLLYNDKYFISRDKLPKEFSQLSSNSEKLNLYKVPDFVSKYNCDFTKKTKKKKTLFNYSEYIKQVYNERNANYKNDKTCLCMARIWGNGYATPCKKLAVKGNDYCITHIGSYQKLGRIDENRTGDGWKSLAIMKEVYVKEIDRILPLDNEGKIIELDIEIGNLPKIKGKKTYKLKIVPKKKATKKCDDLIKERYLKRNKKISKKKPICLARTWSNTCGLPCANGPRDGTNYCGNHKGILKLGRMDQNIPDGYDWDDSSIYKEINSTDGSGKKIPINQDGTHIL